MAVDTRNKLFSLLRLNKPYTVNLPDPVISFDQGDLQHFLNGYSGILWNIPAAGIDVDIITLPGFIVRELLVSGEVQRELSVSGNINREEQSINGSITRLLNIDGEIQREVEVPGDLE